jgi:membrane protease YdiL (CAAX protease family)
MFHKQNFKTYFTYALLAAIGFCIPVLFYLRSPEFIDTWLLFLGNALFLVIVSVFVLMFNKKRHENASTQNMNAAGHIVTFVGVVISALLSFILLMMYVPDIFSSGTPDTVVENAPSQTRGGKTDGLVTMLFMNAVIGNFAAGSFAAIILPYTAKRNQTKDKRSEVLEN